MSELPRRRPFAALREIDPPRTIAVTGTLDLASICGLQDELYSVIAAGDGRLIVDLSRVRLCDAAAMSGLVQVSQHCREQGGWLRLAHPIGIVATAFQIVSFGLYVEVYRTVSAAAVGAPDDRIMRSGWSGPARGSRTGDRDA